MMRTAHRTVRTLLISLLLAGLLAGCASRKPHPSSMYAQGDFKSALELGREWLDEHPEDLAVRRVTGRAALRMELPDLAYALWRPGALAYARDDRSFAWELLEMATDRADLEIAQGILDVLPREELPAHQKTRYDQWQAVVSRARHDAQRDVRMGDEALLEGDVFRAHDYYRRAIHSHAAARFKARERVTIAWRLALEQAATEARIVELLDQAIQLWPSSLTWTVRGAVLREIGREELAMKALRKAIELDSPRDWALFARTLSRSL